jgi:hypothetical protein
MAQNYCDRMTRQRGVALILALLVLTFLAVLGGALLTTSTIDARISENYKADVQTLHVAEAGIEHARELLRTGADSPTQLLTAAAGLDGVISTSVDSQVLQSSDDVPLVPAAHSLRTPGQALVDSSGSIIGRYHVWLRNDNADGRAIPADSNQVLTLFSIGRTANAEKMIEVTVRKARFAPDEPSLKTVAGLEEFVSRIEGISMDVYSPLPGSSQAITNYGTANDYRLLLVNGNVSLGSGTGYGILVARGDVEINGDFTWNGLVLIIGRGTLRWNSAFGLINGGVFIAETRAEDGSLLNELRNVTMDFGGGTDPRIRVAPAAITAANRLFPYVPIAVREY